MGKRAASATATQSGKSAKVEINLGPWRARMCQISKTLTLNFMEFVCRTSTVISLMYPEHPKPCHLSRTRNYDPSKDEHPMAWLLDFAKAGLYEGLNGWLGEVLGEALPQPSTVTMPDRPTKVNLAVEFKNQVHDCPIVRMPSGRRILFRPVCKSRCCALQRSCLLMGYRCWETGCQRPSQFGQLAMKSSGNWSSSDLWGLLPPENRSAGPALRCPKVVGECQCCCTRSLPRTT